MAVPDLDALIADPRYQGFSQKRRLKVWQDVDRELRGEDRFKSATVEGQIRAREYISERLQGQFKGPKEFQQDKVMTKTEAVKTPFEPQKAKPERPNLFKIAAFVLSGGKKTRTEERRTAKEFSDLVTPQIQTGQFEKEALQAEILKAQGKTRSKPIPLPDAEAAFLSVTQAQRVTERVHKETDPLLYLQSKRDEAKQKQEFRLQFLKQMPEDERKAFGAISLFLKKGDPLIALAGFGLTDILPIVGKIAKGTGLHHVFNLLNPVNSIDITSENIESFEQLSKVGDTVRAIAQEEGDEDFLRFADTMDQAELGMTGIMIHSIGKSLVTKLPGVGKSVVVGGQVEKLPKTVSKIGTKMQRIEVIQAEIEAARLPLGDKRLSTAARQIQRNIVKDGLYRLEENPKIMAKFIQALGQNRKANLLIIAGLAGKITNVGVTEAVITAHALRSDATLSMKSAVDQARSLGRKKSAIAETSEGSFARRIGTSKAKAKSRTGLTKEGSALQEENISRLMEVERRKQAKATAQAIKQKRKIPEIETDADLRARIELEQEAIVLDKAKVNSNKLKLTKRIAEIELEETKQKNKVLTDRLRNIDARRKAHEDFNEIALPFPKSAETESQAKLRRYLQASKELGLEPTMLKVRKPKPKPIPTINTVVTETKPLVSTPTLVTEPLTKPKLATTKTIIERPVSPAFLKKPISELSDKELLIRSKKASPAHRHYMQEIAWRKQQTDKLEAQRSPVTTKAVSVSKPKLPQAPNITPQKIKLRPTESFVKGTFRSKKDKFGVVVNAGLDTKTKTRQISSITFSKSFSTEQKKAWVEQHIASLAGKTKKPSTKTGVKDLVAAITPISQEATKLTEESIGSIRKVLQKIKSPISKLGAKLGQMTNLETTKKLEMQKVWGKDLKARILEAIFHPEAEVELNFFRKTFKRKIDPKLDRSIKKALEDFKHAEEWFAKVPESVRLNVNRARGNPASIITEKGKEIQKLARESLTPEQIRMSEAVQEVADYIFKSAQKINPDVNYVKSYFYGIFKNPEAVKAIFENAANKKTTLKMFQNKTIPTFADMEAMGLKLRDNNPITNLRSEFEALKYVEAMNDLSASMKAEGHGIYIIKNTLASTEQLRDWKSIGNGRYTEPFFEGFLVHPDAAHVINSLIAKNKFSGGVLSILRGANRSAQYVSFFAGVGFHWTTIFANALADQGFGGILRPIKTAKTLFNTVAPRAFSAKEMADPIFQTFMRNGLLRRTTLEMEASSVFEKTIFSPGGNMALKILRAPGRAATAVPRKLVKSMFEDMIPRMKYEKSREQYMKIMNRTGRVPTSYEIQEIIKETQNLYGEMNERLFGRSGTMTSLMRLFYLAPGYAEGNFRMIGKSIMQAEHGTRSRSVVAHAWPNLMMQATVVRRGLEGEWPEFPTNLDELRDFVKIRTGIFDDKGKEVRIDLATFEKDVFETVIRPGFYAATGETGKAADLIISELFNRSKNMTGPVGSYGVDLIAISQGKAIYDYKENRIIYVTDTRLQALGKLLHRAYDEITPISMSVYASGREKNLGALASFMVAVAGKRLTRSEPDMHVQKLAKHVWSLKDQQKQLYYELGKIETPRASIKKYNEMVERIYADPELAQGIRTDAKLQKEDLLVNTDKLLASKLWQLTSPGTSADDQEKAVEYLKNFGFSTPQSTSKLFRQYRKDNPKVKNETIMNHMKLLRSRWRKPKEQRKPKETR